MSGMYERVLSSKIMEIDGILLISISNSINWRKNELLGFIQGLRLSTCWYASFKDILWNFIRYARHIEADLLTPAIQWISTLPPSKQTWEQIRNRIWITTNHNHKWNYFQNIWKKNWTYFLNSVSNIMKIL